MSAPWGLSPWLRISSAITRKRGAKARWTMPKLRAAPNRPCNSTTGGPSPDWIAFRIMRTAALRQPDGRDQRLQIGLRPRAVMADHLGRGDAAYPAAGGQGLAGGQAGQEPGGVSVPRARRVQDPRRYRRDCHRLIAAQDPAAGVA